MRAIPAAAVVLALLPAAAGAQELSWKPLSPSFGGEPYNAGFLMNMAQITNRHIKDPVPEKTLSDQEQFLANVKSRVYSRLATQVSDMIFGENPKNSGTINLGDQTISYERIGNEVVMTMVENGKTTTMRFPVQN